jgi:thioredoxin 1
MTDAPIPSRTSNALASKPSRSVFLWLWRWFWRVNLVVSLGLAWYCFYVPSNNIAWADSYASAQQQAADSGKPIILFFTGEWCVPCRIMKRNVWADQQVAALVNAGFIPVTIDMDNPGAVETAKRYRVGSTPNTVITDPEGNVLQQKGGGMAKTDFLELLRKVSSSSVSVNP